MIDNLADTIKLNTFADDMDNAKRAIKDANFERAIIMGNRVLSDFAICWESLTPQDREIVAVAGSIIRIIGINLQNLSFLGKQFPTVRLRNSAIGLVSSMKEAMSKQGISTDTLVKMFADYTIVWSKEVNDSENASYRESKEFECTLLGWANSTLENSSNLHSLRYSFPFHGITNEISRILFERRGNRPLHELLLLMYSLQWQHEMASKIEQYLRQYDKRSKDVDEVSPYLLKTKEYSDRALKALKTLTGASPDATESYSSLMCDILRNWRDSLNVYYQFNTMLPLTKMPKASDGEKEEGEGGSK